MTIQNTISMVFPNRHIPYTFVNINKGNIGILNEESYKYF